MFLSYDIELCFALKNLKICVLLPYKKTKEKYWKLPIFYVVTIWSTPIPQEIARWLYASSSNSASIRIVEVENRFSLMIVSECLRELTVTPLSYCQGSACSDNIGHGLYKSTRVWKPAVNRGSICVCIAGIVDNRRIRDKSTTGPCCFYGCLTLVSCILQ